MHEDLELYENEEPASLASKFSQKHGLGLKDQELLIQKLKQQVEEEIRKKELGKQKIREQVQREMAEKAAACLSIEKNKTRPRETDTSKMSGPRLE